MRKLSILVVLLVAGFATAQFGPYPIIANAPGSGSGGATTVVIAGAGTTVTTNSASSYTVASTVASLADATNNDTKLAIASTNQSTVVSNGISARLTKSISFSFDGSGQVISSGFKGCVEVPSACTIISATLMADQAGSIAIETWRTNGAVASYPPTRAGVLFTNYLTSASKSTDFALANNTSLSLGETNVLGFNVITNASAITRITLQLRVVP